LRLADMYSLGMGVTLDAKKAFDIYQTLADKKIVLAEHNVGVCYEYGKGTEIDYKKAEEWYRNAARQGYNPSIYNLGTLYANDRIAPRNDIEGLTLLLEAAELVDGNDPRSIFVREDQAGHVKRMLTRMTTEDIGKAKLQAAERARELRARSGGPIQGAYPLSGSGLQ